MITHTNSIMPFGKVNLSLTAEAISFLSETTNGTSHFAILGQLIKNTSVAPSSTSKRGNVITLGVGQVECSVHSCCAQFGIGRKRFEAIMRQMEQHGIIRMHRSRLATVADLTCITSWLLPDGSTMCLTALMAIRQIVLTTNSQTATMPHHLTAVMSMPVKRMPFPFLTLRVQRTQTALRLQKQPKEFPQSPLRLCL